MFWLWLAVGLVIWGAVVLLIAKWIGTGMGGRRSTKSKPGSISPSRRSVAEPEAETRHTRSPPELVKR